MSWDDIIGQNRAKSILRRSIDNNRVHQAYLFQGPDGVGKHLVAKELVKTLNCERRVDGACNECNSCSKIDRDIHPDGQIISPIGMGIKIEQIHKIRERIYLKPMEGRYKFYIFDRAEGLVRPRGESGNALLKLLEEPPNDTIFILIPTEGQMLLPTIASRCQKLRFDYLTFFEVKKILQEKFFYEEEMAGLAAGFSFGRVDRALSFKEEEQKKEREEVHQNLKSPFLRNLLQWAKELSMFREKTLDLLDIMMIWFRDLLIYKITNRRELLINVDHLKDIRTEQKDTVQNIIKKIHLVQKTKWLIEHNVNLQLALEVMFIEMTEGTPGRL